MADFADDAFGDAQFAGAPPPEAGGPIDMSEFEQAAGDSLPAAEANGQDHFLHDVVQLSTAESQAAFIGGYTPHPIDSFSSVPASPAAPAGVVDPRVQWNQKNQDALLKKDAEEAATKKACAEKAKAHLAQVDAERAKLLAARKKANRDAETVSPEAGVPKGATWEKVNLLINFNQDKAHTKDMSRFKACLQACKTLNVPVSVRAQ